MGFEQTIITGNVGGAPETRNVSGTNVTSFSVAVTRTVGRGDQKRKITKWFRVNAWSALSDIAAQYVRKGDQITIIGTVEAKAYISKQGGGAMASLDLRADQIVLLGNGGGNGIISDEGAAEDYGADDAGATDEIPF